MHTLFDKPYGTNPRRSPIAAYDVLMRKMKVSLHDVVMFYRNSSYFVKSNHLLVKMITSTPTMRHLNLEDYMYFNMEFTANISRQFNITSSIVPGRSFYPGIFLGVDSEEVIVLTNNRFNIKKFEANWENYSPIRFMRHPKTDLNLNMPFGKSTSDELGTSVIFINFPMLMCQYRLWKNEKNLALRQQSEQRRIL